MLNARQLLNEKQNEMFTQSSCLQDKKQDFHSRHHSPKVTAAGKFVLVQLLNTVLDLTPLYWKHGERLLVLGT